MAEEVHSESLTVQLRCDLDPTDDSSLLIQRWFPDGGHTKAPTREQLASFGWRYMRANRAGSTALLDGPDSAVHALLEATDLGGSRTELIKVLKEFNTKLGKAESISSLLTQVAEHLSRSMPRTVYPADLLVQSTADPDKDVLGNVAMFIKRDDHAVSLVEQSDGVRQLMAMTLFDLAEGGADIVAIDEPELHLHPASQRTIAELISGDGNQKVVVTHSPYIVQRFEPYEVIALDHAGKAHQVHATNMSAVEKQQVSWWSPALLEALTSRYVIVVEGIADRIIVEAVAHAKGVDLDRLGAVVLELGGAENFVHVHRFLGNNGFGTTLLGLVDQAESPKWIGAIGGKPKHVVDRHVFISDVDLEDEYCRGLTAPAAAQALEDGRVARIDALLDSAGVATLAELTTDALASYCRKHKVEAAVAIAASLTQAQASAIASASGLINRLAEIDTL